MNSTKQLSVNLTMTARVGDVGVPLDDVRPPVLVDSIQTLAAQLVDGRDDMVHCSGHAFLFLLAPDDRFPVAQAEQLRLLAAHLLHIAEVLEGIHKVLNPTVKA